MGSTVFICSVKWHDDAKEKGRDYFGETWLGVEEDHTFIYEGDVSVAEFMDFKGEISWVDGERLWDYSKTTILHCPD